MTTPHRPESQPLNERNRESASAVNFSAGNSRRAFFSKLGGIAAASLAATTAELRPFAKPTSGRSRADGAHGRANECFSIRERAAIEEREVPIPTQVTNGDEERFPNFIGNYSKGLPHNAIGEVDRPSYEQFLDAVSDATVAAFENVPLGGTVKLVNPLAGVAFDLEGTDSQQLAIGPPPAVASQARADDMVELYWMSLCRDINFADYDTNATAQASAAELSSIAAFAGPKPGGQVTPETLFRGFTTDDVIGPYISQFLLKPFNYGQYPISGKINTYSSGIDYLKDPASWLAVRNGQPPSGKNQIDSLPRYIRNGRDLSAYVHIDQVYEAFYNAAIWLFAHGAPPNPGNPYLSLTKHVFLHNLWRAALLVSTR